MEINYMIVPFKLKACKLVNDSIEVRCGRLSQERCFLLGPDVFGSTVHDILML